MESKAAGSTYRWSERWSISSHVRSSTVRSQAPNVGIVGAELPQATSSMVGSTARIAAALSAARRPYSAAVVAPICHGPSISLPRHHVRTPCGSRMAVGDPSIAPGRAGRAIHVLHEPPCRRGAARAQVHGEHRFDADEPRPLDELVGPDEVRLDRPPGEVRPRRSAALAVRRRPPSRTPIRSCRRDSARSRRRGDGPGRRHRGASRHGRPSGARARRSPRTPPGPCAR